MLFELADDLCGEQKSRIMHSYKDSAYRKLVIIELIYTLNGDKELRKSLKKNVIGKRVFRTD